MFWCLFLLNSQPFKEAYCFFGRLFPFISKKIKPFSYDENLTLKDLEDLISLIRISNNDALQELGLPRFKGNDLQVVEQIHPGSIDIVTTLSVVASTLTISEYIFKLVGIINKKIQSEREKDLSGTKKDKKVYYKFPITVTNQNNTLINNLNINIVNIHIHNKEDLKKISKILKLK